MVVILVTHDIRFGKNLSRNLFCDAMLTKDGVTLIPVHKIILASVSAKFRKVFEDGGGGLTIVPVVDFPNLKRVVNFIYEGQISFGSQEELNEFSDALTLLKVEVEHTITTMESAGNGELRVLDVKHIGAQEIEASTSAASQDLNHEKLELESLRRQALSTLKRGNEKRKSRSKDCRSSAKRETERSRSQLSNGKRRGRGGEVSSERSINQSAERTRSPLSISSRGGDVGSGGEYSRSSRSGRSRSPLRRRDREERNYGTGKGGGHWDWERDLNSRRDRQKLGNGKTKQDVRSRIGRNFSRVCYFFQDGSCTKGDSCSFSHDVSQEREQLERRRDADDLQEDPGADVIYLRDKTFSVRTVDIEEHLSKFGDVVKVKFIGRQERGNLFKVVVVGGIQRRDRKEVDLYFTVCGVRLEKECREGGCRGSHTGDGSCRYCGSSRMKSKKPKHKASQRWRGRQSFFERQGREAMDMSKSSSRGDRSSSRGSERQPLQQSHLEVDLNSSLVENSRRKTWSPFRGQTQHFVPHFLERVQAKGSGKVTRSRSRDLELPPVAAGPATLSETSVDSFLREVRIEVEASKVKLEDEEEDVAAGSEKVKKEGCATLAGKVKADEVVGRDGVTVKNELLEDESLGNRGANLAGETQE